ncbi:hypothetical protein CANARDRAFT_6450 [[Candida] arabinofermentans NRRL YB-2248]|uniref:Uncharacterized protein n=1 Tax=[Candida] arabinofermentans NRRL YB-2248 TaxID=983967 RepID=A0A1E4T539_9ASCO|nr:hypothetical protein CANARDRAFT_6450 [[Candida] arabinofermentans NRRL YB-2248]
MFLVFLLVIVLVVLIVIILPQTSGLFTYAKNPAYEEKRKLRKISQTSKSQKKEDDFGTYVAPDEEEGFQLKDSNEKKSKLKSFGTGVYTKLNSLTQEDIPVTIHLQNDNILKKRTTKKASNITDRNPDNYDYDLNDLIAEELEKDEEESRVDSSKLNSYREV